MERTVGGTFGADLNKGAGGRVVNLCVARGSGPPVTNIVMIIPDKGETFPPGAVSRLADLVSADRVLPWGFLDLTRVWNCWSSPHLLLNPGFHGVKHLATGKNANLNTGTSGGSEVGGR